MRVKSLFYGGEQPWQEQFCQIHRHGQLVSLMEPCITGDTSAPLTVDPATTTMPTPRLPQRYQTMTPTSPLSPAVRSSLCSHQVSNRWFPLRSGWSVSSWRWLFRMTSQTGLSLAVLCHPSALSSKTSLKIMGCPHWLLTKSLHWRWRPIGAAFQGKRLSQHCRDAIDASAFSFCGILPLQLT